MDVGPVLGLVNKKMLPECISKNQNAAMSVIGRMTNNKNLVMLQRLNRHNSPHKVARRKESQVKLTYESDDSSNDDDELNFNYNGFSQFEEQINNPNTLHKISQKKIPSIKNAISPRI